jgi:hypothetical protein
VAEPVEATGLVGLLFDGAHPMMNVMAIATAMERLRHNMDLVDGMGILSIKLHRLLEWFPAFWR